MTAIVLPSRKILHIDMDAFFASVEQRDNPALRGLPVAVGGSSARGVVAAASYEARKFGVRSAMPSVTALRRCPDLIFVKGRFDAYREASNHIRAIFDWFADAVEPLSLDEAYLDVTSDRRGLGSARATAEAIRRRVFEATRLTASAGVSYCKFVAKLASDQNKPDGLCVIPPSKGAAFVASLPIERFHGVGPKTAAKMRGLGIHTGADLAAMEPDALARHFGSSAEWYWKISRGIDDRPVRAHRVRKSLGSEDTFFEDLADRAALLGELERIGNHVWDQVEKRGIAGRTVVLKVKYRDFQIITRSATLAPIVPSRAAFLEAGAELLTRLMPPEKPIRLLGLTLANLVREEEEPIPTPAPELPLFMG